MSVERIMVVEDERIFALDLSQRLRAAGYEVVGVAANGEQALALASEHSPSIVLMDIHLEGGVDGITIAAELLRRHHVPVVFLTAYAEEDVVRRAQGSEAYGYLVKPCDTRELMATLGMALARRRAEVTVEHNEERLRFALDTADMGVWEWRQVEDRFSAIGPVEGIFGAPPEVVDGGVETLLSRIADSDRPQVLQALLTSGSLNGCFRSTRGDGGSGWLEVHARPFMRRNGDDLRVVGVIKDVTVRRDAEERLRQASVVFETTAEGIIITDAVRTILSVNSAFNLITGLPSGALIGQDPDRVLHLRPHGEAFYQRLLEAPMRQWQGEVMCRRATGEPFPGWEQVSLVVDEEGAVSHVVFAISDLSAVRRAEAQLDYLAHHDPLTGLPNRLLFNERISQLIYHARRQQRGFTLVFIDLDDFKVINDTLGHNSGDELLKVISARLHSVVRRSDTLARLGGDEFVMLLAEMTDPQRCASLALKVLAAVAEPLQLGNESVQVSASVGIALFPHDGDDADPLIKAADSAMYHAKAGGRNRFAFFDVGMARRAEERLFLEQGLRRALELEQFELHYQPLVELASGALIGAEALLRWRHPQLGLIAPDRFIPVAETTGLIEPIGLWVLRRACLDAASWPQVAGRALTVAVNVSVRQCRHADFSQQVAAALNASGLAASQLEMELTESILQSGEEIPELLQRLHQLGVALAIDDFGTGYSCLSTLKGLAVDRLKIDRSFVTDLPHDHGSNVIARTILAMGSNLGLTVTAEGVETEAQRQWLGEQGCPAAQGYLFSRPLPLAPFAQLLVDWQPWPVTSTDLDI